MSITPADRLSHFREYYFSRKLKELADLQSAGHEVINLGIGSPDFPPDPEVVEALKSEADQPNVHGYQSYQGLPQLRQAIASFYQEQYKCDLSQLAVLPLMGSKEGITHISLAYLNPTDEVLIPSLGYPTYTSVTKMVGGLPVFFPLLEDHQWEPDWDFLEKLDTSRVKIMWINYPHMPTGTDASMELLEKYVAYAKDRDILLCHDNPYSFVLNDSPKSIFNIDGAESHCLELSSVSKTFSMAGWRVGWMVGNPSLIDPPLKIKSNMDSGMFRPVQIAAIRALSLGENWYQSMNAQYSQRRHLVYKILDLLGCAYDENQKGMFVWARALGHDGEGLSDKILAKHHIFITPGFIFGEAGREYVRVSLCASQDILKKAHDRLL